MTPGTLFFDPHFRFHDGEEGKKILITMGALQGVTLVVKTTSQNRRFRNDYGCQADCRYPNFHLTKGCCCLPKSTWVCLDEFYEFKGTDLLQKHFSGDIHRIGQLTDAITMELMECALKSDDISPRQSKIVESAMVVFLSGTENDL